MEKSTPPTIPLLEMEGIVKSFPGTIAVDKVDFRCKRGEIHAIVGENGAGKSTLMKVLAGIHLPDSGKIFINGQEKRFRNYSEARNAGVGVVYQELSLLPDLSVSENISMGVWPKSNSGLIDWQRTRRRCERILDEIGMPIDPDELVDSLPMALRQMVEIAKVLTQNPEILVFDEPTAALSKDEVKILFHALQDLKKKEKAIVFISHRLDEVLAISDVVTVMRDGQKVISEKTTFLDEDKLISYMVGREFSEIFPAKSESKAEKRGVFSFEGVLKRSGRRVAFSVHRGEVLGIGGLQGQGQLDLLESIFGLGLCREIEIRVLNRPVAVNNPVQAMRSGIALIPENRNEEGIFLILPILENLAASTVDNRKALGFVRKKTEMRVVEGIIQDLSIRSTSLRQLARSLSGGNLQKLVLGKWLISNPKVMVMLEPTKGVDVATKQQIYRLIRDLAGNNVAVIVYTSDMLELIGLCDRVLVMNHGFLTANLQGDDITEENIMKGSVSNIDLITEGRDN